jgi:sterol desaturase/sphingolipid hydroxylase (fatty acid hydroxylase superfamily)
MMFYSWISFWLTYFIGGCFLYNDTHIKMMSNSITTKELLHTLGVNALVTFLFIPIANMIPTIIYYPDTLIGYIFRIITAVIIGDLCFYWSHRLFHRPFFYFLHKKHHLYIIPHSLAGLYCSPIEMLIANHLSIVLALKLVSIHSTEMLMLESAVIALNILKSHSGVPSYFSGSPHHALHHDKMNCNYGFSYITDIVFGTYAV